MPKAFILACVLMICCFSTMAQPRFRFTDSMVHDFGNVPEGPKISCSFRFENAGDKPLIIRHVTNTTGSDPDMVYPKAPIQPGKTGEIKVSFVTAGRGGSPFYRPVIVYSNDTSHMRGTFHLAIKGYIVKSKNDSSGAKLPVFRFKDTFPYDFGIVPPDKPVTREFVFENTGDTPLVITRATSGDGATNCEWPKEPIQPGKSAAIKMRFDTKGKRGSIFNRTIYISSNATPGSGLTEIRFKGRVKE